jgi:hypothetical protein
VGRYRENAEEKFIRHSPDDEDLIAKLAQLFLFGNGFPILRRTKPALPRRFGYANGLTRLKSGMNFV